MDNSFTLFIEGAWVAAVALGALALLVGVLYFILLSGIGWLLPTLVAWLGAAAWLAGGYPQVSGAFFVIGLFLLPFFWSER